MLSDRLITASDPFRKWAIRSIPGKIRPKPNTTCSLKSRLMIKHSTRETEIALHGDIPEWGINLESSRTGIWGI